eukprot:scaffold270781_cov31-Tisochrysis_lutea.AAC.4
MLVCGRTGVCKKRWGRGRRHILCLVVQQLSPTYLAACSLAWATLRSLNTKWNNSGATGCIVGKGEASASRSAGSIGASLSTATSRWADSSGKASPLGEISTRQSDSAIWVARTDPHGIALRPSSTMPRHSQVREHRMALEQQASRSAWSRDGHVKSSRRRAAMAGETRPRVGSDLLVDLATCRRTGER